MMQSKVYMDARFANYDLAGFNLSFQIMAYGQSKHGNHGAANMTGPNCSCDVSLIISGYIKLKSILSLKPYIQYAICFGYNTSSDFSYKTRSSMLYFGVKRGPHVSYLQCC